MCGCMCASQTGWSGCIPTTTRSSATTCARPAPCLGISAPTMLCGGRSATGVPRSSHSRPTSQFGPSALPAAARLLRQSGDMLPERSGQRVQVLVELAYVLLTSGQLEEAEETLTEAGEIAVKTIGDAPPRRTRIRPRLAGRPSGGSRSGARADPCPEHRCRAHIPPASRRSRNAPGIPHTCARALVRGPLSGGGRCLGARGRARSGQRSGIGSAGHARVGRVVGAARPRTRAHGDRTVPADPRRRC